MGSGTGTLPDEKEDADVADVDRPAFFASSAAKVERTDVMMYWEEVEAASLSATSAAIAAADFLDVCSVVFELVQFDGFESNTRSSSKFFRMFVASSTCACAT